MSQSCFSFGFLSQNSLWKLSTFHGYKGIYNSVCEECEKSFFYKIEHFGDSLVSGISCEFKLRVNCQARLSIFFFYSAPTIVTFQFPACFTRVAFWQVASCESIARSNRENPLNAHTLEFFTLFSHITLTLFPPKYRVSNC